LVAIREEFVQQKIATSVWILNPSTSLFGTFHAQHGGKRLLLQLLWIVISEFIGATSTSTSSNNS